MEKCVELLFSGKNEAQIIGFAVAKNTSNPCKKKFPGYFIYFKIKWRLSTILKTRKKSVWSDAFWYVKVCIFLEYIQCTIHWDKTQMLKKFRWTKQTEQKMPSFFFRELQLITILFLICDSYMSWSTQASSL